MRFDFTLNQYNENVYKIIGGKDEDTAQDFYEPGTVLAQV